MFEYPAVSLTLPFYCRMKEQCVLEDVVDETTLSDPFDTKAPNFLYPLGTLMGGSWQGKQLPLICDYYPTVEYKLGASYFVLPNFVIDFVSLAAIGK